MIIMLIWRSWTGWIVSMSMLIMFVVQKAIINVAELWLILIFNSARSKGHGVKAIASCELSYLFQTHSLFHHIGRSTMQYLLAEPSPNPTVTVINCPILPFPCPVRINVKSIEDHCKARWSTILWLRLCRILFSQPKVVLHCPLH
jgi:hypothetical protein